MPVPKRMYAIRRTDGSVTVGVNSKKEAREWLSGVFDSSCEILTYELVAKKAVKT